MLNHLAIVIPAFKLPFLEQSLNSIFSQTNRNFTLYIGDDNSPEDLYSVIKKYESFGNLVYKKFPENIGQTSVVQHWERCVAMTKGEEWIWLFSDDDIMSDDCVDLFLQQVHLLNTRHDVYRFNCSIINEDGKKIVEKTQYPEIQSSFDFLNSRLTFQHHSYIVNCIFSRFVFNRYNGFVDFKAAWAADDAIWIMFGAEKKIFTFKDGEVKWRESSINISGNTGDKINRSKKYEGTEQYIEWIYRWAQRNNVMIEDKLVINWLFKMLIAIGYNNVVWMYLKSKAFRNRFWKRNYAYQLKCISSDFYKIFK